MPTFRLDAGQDKFSYQMKLSRKESSSIQFESVGEWETGIKAKEAYESEGAKIRVREQKAIHVDECMKNNMHLI